VKGVAGYDIPRLAVGSLGTLGVIVQATIKLWPMPRARGWFAAQGSLDHRLAAAERLLAGPVRPAAVLVAPGRVAVELTGPPEDVTAPEGFAPLAEAPPAVAGEGLMEVGVSPPRLGELARALEAGGRDYEARMGVGTCTVAIARADDVAAVRAAATALGGHAVVSDAPDALREDPWGGPPPGIHLMRRLRVAFDPAGILNRRQLLWA
jgi:glycolate oxidase FAD binding subunit